MSLQRDYIVDMLIKFADAIRRSMVRSRSDNDPADAAAILEAAIGEATDLDGDVLLSLAPESIASVLQVSGTDPAVIEYLSRSLLLESDYLNEAGNDAVAEVRKKQAYALAEAYNIPLSEEAITGEALDDFLSNDEESVD